MFRRSSLRVSAAIGLFALVASLSMTGMAAAAPTTTTGYPPTTTTSPINPGPFGPSSPSSPVVVTPGSSGVYTLSGCLPGNTATITVNGQTAANVVADTNGYVTLTINWLNLKVSINGGAAITVPSGANTITMTCTGPNGLVTKSAYFSLTSSNSGSGGLAFTGADIAAMALGALVLVGSGGILILTTRRRGSKRTAR